MTIHVLFFLFLHAMIWHDEWIVAILQNWCVNTESMKMKLVRLLLILPIDS